MCIDTVLPGSLAEKGGLKYGDFLVELNGNDIRAFSKESVISAIKSSNRSTLSLRVGRVRPIPVTSEDKKLAVQMIQEKVRARFFSPNPQLLSSVSDFSKPSRMVLSFHV